MTQKLKQAGWIKSSVTAALFAVFAVSLNSHALTPGDCSVLLSSFNPGRGAKATGTKIGNTTGDRTSVKHLTSTAFDPGNWDPANDTVYHFNLEDYTTYMLGNYKGVQIYNGSDGMMPAVNKSETEQLYISDSGRIWSRSLNEYSGWKEWEDVTCYAESSEIIDLEDGTSLGRILITGFNPEGGYLTTLEIREWQWVI